MIMSVTTIAIIIPPRSEGVGSVVTEVGVVVVGDDVVSEDVVGLVTYSKP